MSQKWMNDDDVVLLLVYDNSFQVQSDGILGKYSIALWFCTRILQ